jgi:hypothetical protein
MTSTELKSQIDSEITNETAPNSVSTIDVGNNLKDIVDYVDQETSALPISIKTSGATTLSAIFSEIPRDINTLSFTNGKGYLPSTIEIGKEVICIANSNNIEIRANVVGTNKMFETFNTFVASVTLLTNEMYRFTYIGFGTGVGGTIDGFWKAEQM